MCCRQSAVTALADLERLGFITRIRRIRQVQTPLGFRTVQITKRLPRARAGEGARPALNPRLFYRVQLLDS
jgi:hypothetical protein